MDTPIQENKNLNPQSPPGHIPIDPHKFSDSLDDQLDELNDFDFKLVNHGLGFHKGHNRIANKAVNPALRKASQKPKPVFQNLEQDQVQEKSSHPYLRSSQRLGPHALRNNNFDESKTSLHLSAQAANEVRSPLELSRSPQTNKVLIVGVKPPSLLLSVSYLIDLFFVTALFLFLCFAFVSLSGLSLNQAYDLAQNLALIDELYPLLILFFASVYLCYFTVVDSARGFGKSLFNLELRTITDEPVGIFNCFSRALVSLFSLPLLFVPALFDFQGMISETKVVRLK